MFTHITEDAHECKKTKGVNNNVAGDKIKYKNSNFFFNAIYIKHEINRTQNKNHNIVTYRVKNVSLSCYDGKRYILESGYHRLSDLHKPTR